MKCLLHRHCDHSKRNGFAVTAFRGFAKQASERQECINRTMTGSQETPTPRHPLDRYHEHHSKLSPGGLLRKMVEYFFNRCCIANALDGMEDDMSCCVGTDNELPDDSDGDFVK